MQGNIDFTGSLTGSIAGSGGGGSNVTITPTLESGTKIADYTIDSTSGSLYAPTPEGLTAELPLEISDNVISIDLSNYVTETDLNTVLDDYTTYTYTESRYTPLATFNAYTIAAENHFQRVLTAGANITIDPVNDIISASGGSTWDYSTSEVDTGQKWINNKSIYCRYFQFANPIAFTGNSDTNVTSYADFSSTEQIISTIGISETSFASIPISAYKYSGDIYARTPLNITLDGFIVFYTKSA